MFGSTTVTSRVIIQSNANGHLCTTVSSCFKTFCCNFSWSSQYLQMNDRDMYKLETVDGKNSISSRAAQALVWTFSTCRSWCQIIKGIVWFNVQVWPTSQQRSWRINRMGLSYLWTILGYLAFVRGLLPAEITEALNRALRLLNSYFVPYVIFEIPEFEGSSINELYKNVQLHLTARDLCRSARKTVLCRVKNSTNTTATLAGCALYQTLFKPSIRASLLLCFINISRLVYMQNQI